MKQKSIKSFRKQVTKSFIAALILMTTGTTAISTSSTVVQAADVKEHALSLGSESLVETRKKIEIAPGLSHIRITRGEGSEKDVFIIDVGFYKTLEEAQNVELKLDEQGYQAKVEQISERAPGDDEQGPLGYLVRVGAFHKEDKANRLKDELKRKGYDKSRVVFSAEDGGTTNGPWVVNVLTIDPKKFKGKVVPEIGTKIVPGKEKLTSISTRTGALAAINGGYFVMGPSDGTEGDLAGVSMINGQLISEAVNGRTSLILDGKNASIESLETHLTVTTEDGSKRELDGLNRKPGFIRGCGGFGDTFDYPKHDFTCMDSGELIQFTSSFGLVTDSGGGTEVVLNRQGRVVEVRKNRGGPIPKGGSVLAATGDASDWLSANVELGEKISVDTRIIAGKEPLKINSKVSIVNGGPRLLRDGKQDITALNEGFHWRDNPEFYYRFGIRRNPRTLAGVTEGGKILMVTVEGRKPGYSVGANFKESAQIMKSLGAINAVNLDGGGSTAMTVESKLITRPSDQTGERPIGDAIVILP